MVTVLLLRPPAPPKSTPLALSNSFTSHTLPEAHTTLPSPLQIVWEGSKLALLRRRLLLLASFSSCLASSLMASCCSRSIVCKTLHHHHSGHMTGSHDNPTFHFSRSLSCSLMALLYLSKAACTSEIYNNLADKDCLRKWNNRNYQLVSSGLMVSLVYFGP